MTNTSYLKQLHFYFKHNALHQQAAELYKLAGDTDYSFEIPNFDFLNKMDFIYELSQLQVNPSVWMNRFIDINSDIFIKDMPVSKIGEGSYGEAWLTESGNVMKIFNGIGALKFYEQEKESFENNDPDALRVYEFGTFRMPEGTKKETPVIGWAIIEKLQNIVDVSLKLNRGSQFRILFGRLFTEIENYLYRHKERNIECVSDADYENLSKIIMKDLYSNTMAAETIRDIKEIGFDTNIILQIIEKAARQKNKGRNDIHKGNLGFREDGRPIYFDPYVSSEEEDDFYRELHNDEIYWDEQEGLDSLRGVKGFNTTNAFYLKQLYSSLRHNALHQQAAELYKLAGDTDYSFEIPNFDFLDRMGMFYYLAAMQKNPSNWKERFIDLNSDIFIKDMPVSKIGQGSYGEAWLTESGNVFKIFRGLGALKFYEEEKALFEKNDEDALRVYDFGVFRLPEGTRGAISSEIIGWVIMEKLRNLDDEGSDEEVLAFHRLMLEVRYFLQLEEDKLANSPNINYRQIAEDIIALIKSEGQITEVLKKLKMTDDNLVQIITNLMRQNASKRIDTHSGNLGFRDDGKMIFFDSFVPSEFDNSSYEESNEKEIYWDEQSESPEFDKA